MSATGHQRWREELAAYELGALDRDEAAAIQAHLGECEVCRAERRQLQGIVDVLGASVPQLDPPPGLRQRLLAAVSADARAVASTKRKQKVSRRRLGLGRPRLAMALAAALAALAAGGYLWANSGGGDSQDSVSLKRASTLAPYASARLIRDGDSGTLEVHGLPRLTAGDVYEVWIKHGGRIRPFSIFVLDREGNGRAAIPGALNRADAVMATREPRGGSAHPSSGPLLWTSLH